MMIACIQGWDVMDSTMVIGIIWGDVFMIGSSVPFLSGASRAKITDGWPKGRKRRRGCLNDKSLRNNLKPIYHIIHTFAPNQVNFLLMSRISLKCIIFFCALIFLSAAAGRQGSELKVHTIYMDCSVYRTLVLMTTYRTVIFLIRF